MTCISALAAVSPDSVSQAISNARILAPGTQLKVKVTGEQAAVSTFRDRRASDKDSKIEALLIGRSVLELPNSGITSVTVYFYDSNSPTQYKSVSIRSSDVKAFGAGQVSQDELLSSIEIKSGQVLDAATSIETKMMLASAARRDIQITDKGDDVEISCKMPALSDEEYKFEAFRIAQTAQTSNLPNAKRILVNFFEPGQSGSYKQVLITLANLSTIEKQIASAFETLRLAKGQVKMKAADLTCSEGALMKERGALLEQIQSLESKGVGVGNFITEFLAIESSSQAGDADALKSRIERLSGILKTQEESYQSAKAHKPVKDGGNNPVATADTIPGALSIAEDEASVNKKVKTPLKEINRWALGYFPMPESSILKDPDGYLVDCKSRFETKEGKKAESSIKYYWALRWFSEVLKTHGRNREAEKFEQQANLVSSQMRRVK